MSEHQDLRSASQQRQGSARSTQHPVELLPGNDCPHTGQTAANTDVVPVPEIEGPLPAQGSDGDIASWSLHAHSAAGPSPTADAAAAEHAGPPADLAAPPPGSLMEGTGGLPVPFIADAHAAQGPAEKNGGQQQGGEDKGGHALVMAEDVPQHAGGEHDPDGFALLPPEGNLPQGLGHEDLPALHLPPINFLQQILIVAGLGMLAHGPFPAGNLNPGNLAELEEPPYNVGEVDDWPEFGDHQPQEAAAGAVYMNDGDDMAFEPPSNLLEDPAVSSTPPVRPPNRHFLEEMSAMLHEAGPEASTPEGDWGPWSDKNPGGPN